jgi:foldase protein PrsA
MSRISRPITLALVAALVVIVAAASGCTTAQSVGSLASVNGVAISAKQVDDQLAQMKKASPTTFEGTQGVSVTQNYRAQILNSLIQLEVIKQGGAQLGVKIDAKQVDNYITQLKTQYGGQSGLDTAMKQAGITLSQLRDSIQSRLLVEQVMAKVTTGTVNVTDAEIAQYYATNKAQYAGQTQVNASHILVATKDKALAQSLFSQVKKGGDFAALAKKYSIDTNSKVKGGNLGWAPSSQYVAEFAQATEQMKIGEIRLVQSSFGWHIIKLIGRKSAKQQTLAEVKAQIKATLTQQQQSDAFGKWVAAQQKKATIVISDATLKKIIDQNTAVTAPSTATTTTK